MFDNGQNKCIDCPIGFYQNEEGSFYCKPCSAMMTTIKAASVNDGLCIGL